MPLKVVETIGGEPWSEQRFSSSKPVAAVSLGFPEYNGPNSSVNIQLRVDMAADRRSGVVFKATLPLKKSLWNPEVKMTRHGYCFEQLGSVSEDDPFIYTENRGDGVDISLSFTIIDEATFQEEERILAERVAQLEGRIFPDPDAPWKDPAAEVAFLAGLSSIVKKSDI